jgi:hypothetical protein
MQSTYDALKGVRELVKEHSEEKREFSILA